MVVICFLHGALIIALLRAKPGYKTVRASELLATVYFINPEPRRVSLPSIPPRLALRSLDVERIPALPPASLPTPTEPMPALNDSMPATPPPVDWLSEAQRSAADIVGRNAPDKAPASAPSLGPIAPWDPHPRGLETTGHGLKLRIIDPCYSDLDLGQTVYGAEARLQLGCTFGKKSARGDLFDSISKPRLND